MKTRMLLAAMLALTIGVAAQTNKVLSNIATFQLTDSGAMIDKNNDVNGYFFFYEVEKLKKGQREYAIKILDQNLNEVATKSYVNAKNTLVLDSKYNGDNIMFAMSNYKERLLELLTYDKKGEPGKTYKIQLDKSQAENIHSRSGRLLYSIEDRGYLINFNSWDRDKGWILRYMPTDGGKGWELRSPEKSKDNISLEIVASNPNHIVLLETIKPSANSLKVSYRTKTVDVNTGNVLFEREYTKAKNPRIISNAFLTPENTVVLMGEYFNDKDNIMRDKSKGLFTEVIDMSGKTVNEHLSAWDGEISKFMKIVKGSKVSDKGYIYFHDIVRTNNGHYFTIGEYYNKTVTAGSVATAMLLGGPVTRMSITDVVMFEYDNNFNLVGTREFEKSESRFTSETDYGSPQLNAAFMKSYGAFDYSYTQLDPANDRFYSCFVDYERIKGEKNKRAFKAIIYDDGEFSEDKIYLTAKDVTFSLMPAKTGNVLLTEYDKKKKEITLHLEKINIK